MPKIDGVGRIDSGLFNLPNEEPGALVARLEDGSRAVVREAKDGYELIRYLNGPYTHVLLERLGLTDAKLVRIRKQPVGWSEASGENPIPAQLRGRLAGVVKLGSSHKYADVGTIRLHRREPGEQRATIEVSLSWLEPVSQPLGPGVASA